MASIPTGYGHLGQAGLDDQVLGKVYDHTVVRRLLKYTLAYKFWAFLSVFGMMGYIITMVAQPLIIAWGINSFIIAHPDEQSSWGNIHIVGLIFVGNALALMVFNFIQYASLARASVYVLYDLRRDMFAHLQKQPTSFFDRNEVGRIMSRVQNDVHQLQEFMDIGIVTLGDIAMLGFITLVMFIMDPFLAAVTLGSVPLLLIIMTFWQKYSRPTFVKVRVAISAVNANLQENISGVRVAQSMNRQSLNLNHFDNLNSDHLEATKKAAWLAAVLLPAVEVLTVVSMSSVIVVGGLMTFEGALEVGFLVAFLMYVQRLFEPIRTLAMQYTQFQRAMASGARIFELLDLVPETQDKPNAPVLPRIEGEIKFENVTFSYNAGEDVLHDINLHVKPGQTVALVGITGAGKTSLVALAARLYEPQHGKILVDGKDIQEYSRESLASQMSMVLQEPFLHSSTIKENIRYRHRWISDDEIVQAAKAVGAHEFISGLPQGYETVLEQRGGNLSIGQRQLVSFARAVAADPRIIVLDEATASVDSHTEFLIQRALKTLLIGRTSIVIAHRLSTITGADKIVVLQLGKIIAEGTHMELLQDSKLYADLYAMNFGESSTS